MTNTTHAAPRRRRWRWALLLLLVTAAAAWQYRRAGAARSTERQGGRSAAVPVTVAKARVRDVPVYLDGLGSATAFKTVTVRSRVDGELVRVGFREGQSVAEGDVLAEIDPRPFQVQREQAEGNLARDTATLANARVDLERYKVLFAQDSIPKQQLDSQAAAVAQLEGSLQVDRAAIDSAKLQLTYCRITAPISGRVGLRLVDPGNIVHASDPGGIVLITQVRPMAVVFTLPEADVRRVHESAASGAPLAVLALDRDGSRVLARGTLLTPDNQIDPTTGTFRLKAVFDNAADELFPNQFVNVRLLVETRRSRVVIPTSAIQRGQQGPYVFVVKPDATAELRTVTPGVAEGDVTEVEGPVAAGDAVVVDGADRLQNGSRVEAREAERRRPA